MQSQQHYEGSHMVLDFMPFELIPQSAIVEECGNDIERMFLLIYEKYIDWKHSSFEINISHSVRQKMHDIYVRITYQLLVDERRQIMMEERIVRESIKAQNGQSTDGHTDTTVEEVDGEDAVNGVDGVDKGAASGLWHSRKTVVNTLKATISKKQLDGDLDADGATNAEEEQMGTVVENEEMIDALTMAEHDIMRNLNDSLTRFRRTPELQQLVAENEMFLTAE